MTEFLSSLSGPDVLRVSWLVGGCIVGLLCWAMGEDSYGSRR